MTEDSGLRPKPAKTTGRACGLFNTAPNGKRFPARPGVIREAGLADKRSKMLTMWVTEDEHRRLLERCDGKQLAAWMWADVPGREARPCR